MAVCRIHQLNLKQKYNCNYQQTQYSDLDEQIAHGIKKF